MEELVFEDLAPKTVPVSISGKQYVLKEATEDAARQWENSQMSNAKFSSDGARVSPGNMADSRSLLVQLCMFEVDDDKHRPVSLGFVRALPHRIVDKLFDTASEISGITKLRNPDMIRKQIELLQKQLRLVEGNSGTEAGTSTSS